jgi:hypothetical protein
MSRVKVGELGCAVGRDWHHDYECDSNALVENTSAKGHTGLVPPYIRPSEGLEPLEEL